MAERDKDNLVDELVGYDPLGSDPALQAALARAQAHRWLPGLQQHARTVGSAAFAQLADQATRRSCSPGMHGAGASTRWSSIPHGTRCWPITAHSS